jgi:hypothetical protein
VDKQCTLLSGFFVHRECTVCEKLVQWAVFLYFIDK